MLYLLLWKLLHKQLAKRSIYIEIILTSSAVVKIKQLLFVVPTFHAHLLRKHFLHVAHVLSNLFCHLVKRPAFVAWVIFFIHEICSWGWIRCHCHWLCYYYLLGWCQPALKPPNFVSHLCPIMSIAWHLHHLKPKQKILSFSLQHIRNEDAARHYHGRPSLKQPLYSTTVQLSRPRPIGNDKCRLNLSPITFGAFCHGGCEAKAKPKICAIIFATSIPNSLPR